MEFKKYKISDIAEVIGGGTPSTKKTEYYGDDIAWLTPKDLSNFNRRYISKGERSLTTLGLQRSSARLMPANTVLFTSRAPIGYVAISKNNISTNQGFKSLICRQDKILPEYMYYLMKFNTPALENQATGSTFKEVSGTIVKNFEVLIPDINEQKKIIGILGSLDSKIELNLDLISKLEEISKVLFKHWFIDFEFPNEEGKPYKSSGGEMVESELGEIPKKWCSKKFNSIMKISSGKRPKIKADNYSLENSIPIIGASKLMGYTREMLFDSPILVIGRVGTHGVVQKIVDRCWPSDNTLVIQSEFYNFVYEFLKVIDYKSLNRGSTQPLITQTDIKNQTIIVPEDLTIMKKFEEILMPLLNKQFLLLKENESLTQLRDTLIPKLLSGEIEIPDELEV